MTFLIFLVASAIAYFAWRVVDQLPDLTYRLSEIQRDVADLRRMSEEDRPADAAQAPADEQESAAEEDKAH